MKNQLNLLLAFVLGVASLTACQNDDAEEVVNSPRSITVSTDYDALTRAGGMTQEELKKKSFYLYIDQNDNAGQDYFVKMKWGDNTWKAYNPADGTTSVILKTNSETLQAKVVALFYDSETVLTKEAFEASGTGYTINSDTESFYSSDMLYAMTMEEVQSQEVASGLNCGQVTIDGTTIKVSFNHALSRLRFNIDCTKIEVSGIQVSEVVNNFTWNAVSNSDFVLSKTKGKFNVALPTVSDPAVRTGESIQTAECFLVPQTSTFKVTVNYKTLSDNKTYKAEYTYSDQNFVSGQSYSMALPPAEGEAQSPITRAAVNEDDWENDSSEGTITQQE